MACLGTFFVSLSDGLKTLYRKLSRKEKPLLSAFGSAKTSFLAAAGVSSQFKQVFKLIDENGDGKISSSELSQVLVCFGHEESKAKQEAEGMVREMDRNGDGFVDLDEFMLAVITDDEKDCLRDAFLIFDQDKNGLISAKELRRVMVRLGCNKCSVRDCKRMIKGVDRDGDGFVDFEEFHLMMERNR